MEENNFFEELKKMKEEFNERIDRLLNSIDPATSSADVLNKSNKNHLDETEFQMSID